VGFRLGISQWENITPQEAVKSSLSPSDGYSEIYLKPGRRRHTDALSAKQPEKEII